jgi:hypothetical protein
MTPLLRRVLDLVPARLHRLIPSDVRADLRHRTGLTAPGDLAFRPVPPVPAPGEHTGPPDFAVLGASDAGSRWWLSMVTDHPEVTPGHRSVAAAHFFAPYCTEPFGAAEVSAFEAWFPRRPGRIIGYWSPDGTAHPWVPPLLALAAPRAQVLVLVRDPVQRLVDVLGGRIDDRPSHPGSFLSDAVERGFYAAQLRQLLECYPADQVRVLQYERCVADPVGSLARTFEFLGVDPGYRTRPLDPPPLAGRPAARVDPGTMDRLRELYAADVAELSELISDLDLALWPHSVGRD